MNISLWWGTYNVLSLSGALLVLLDSPKLSMYQWFKTQRDAEVITAEGIVQARTTRISEEGMEIEIDKKMLLSRNVTLKLVNENIQLNSVVTKTRFQDNQTLVRVKFTDISLDCHRQLVETLYCQPGQWQRKQSPGELHSLFILLKLFVRPLNFILKKQLRLTKPHLSLKKL